MQNNELTLIKMLVRYNKTVVDFILGSRVTLVPRLNNTPLALSKHIM